MKLAALAFPPCLAGAIRHPSLADGGGGGEDAEGAYARPALLMGS